MDIVYLYGKYKECGGRVTTDSRRIAGGELFFALKGENFDGNEYALKALEAGAAYAVVDRGAAVAAGLSDVSGADASGSSVMDSPEKSVVPEGLESRLIPVEDTLAALQALARWHRSMSSADGKPLPVIALTGTNGKTTTKELIKAVLETGYRVTATEGNLNNSIGVPLTLLKITSRTQIAVVEMGASHPGDIKELVSVALPTYGLITNVGKAHLLGFGSFEGVMAAKGELYDYLQRTADKAFVNADNPYLNEMALARPDLRTVRYGLGYEGAEVLPASPQSPYLRIRLSSGTLVETRLVGEYNADNVMAALAVERGYVRPKITTNGNIVIKNGRHPVVEVFKKKNEFVPNDIVMDDSSRLLVITGPNMAGKSTYMREAALIVLMAHMGSFVPADEAEISVVDRVFTRVGAGDNLVSGQSTFMVEMTEMANILNSATAESLIILDEVGRGTSTIDGLSIAWAIVEYLSLKLKAKTLFATHYHELAELENTLPGLKNYHVLVKESSGGVTFLYKIARGAASKSFGLEVARLAGIKDEVIARASSVMAAIEESSEINLKKSISERPGSEAVPSEEQLGFFGEDAEFTRIKSILNDIDPNSVTPMQALTILSDLKNSIKTDKKRKKR